MSCVRGRAKADKKKALEAQLLPLSQMSQVSDGTPQSPSLLKKMTGKNQFEKPTSKKTKGSILEMKQDSTTID